MTLRPRKPANVAERDALAVWQEASPHTAMTILHRAGYSQSARAEFLRNVTLVSQSDVDDFASGYYVTDITDGVS